MKTMCPNCKSQLPAETIAGNEDLITQILLCVPVKPVLRFKSVSKSWQSLISSPRFARLYTLHNPNSVVSGLFLRRTLTEFQFLSLNANSSDKAPFRSLNFAHDPAGIKILQSCNGLLLCSSFTKVGFKRNYYVYNPTTNNFSTLPSLTVDSKTAVFGVNLAFDPALSSYYKVVCVRSTEKSMYYYQIQVYESESGAWRLSGSPFVAPFDVVFDNGVFWNGAIIWTSPRGASFYFDLNNESITKMCNLPVLSTWESRRLRYFGESRGHLHLIEIYGPRSTQFKVFEMSRDYSNWFVKYEIDLQPLLTVYPEMVRSYLDLNDSNYYAFVPLHFIRDGNGVDAWLLLHVPGRLLSYNVRDKSCKLLFEWGGGAAADGDESKKGSLQFGWLDAYAYIESLAPVC